MRLLCIIIFSFAFEAFAKEEVNLEDKTETHIIAVKGKQTGTVKISARFVGEAIMESTEIKISIKCAPGLKLDNKLKKNQTMMVYDYGNKGKLSEFDAQTNTLTIFYRTAKNVNESPTFDKSKTLEVPLETACR